MNYSQATNFLFNSFPSYQNIGSQAYKEGIQGITEMCRLLGDPQKNYLTIHVAGTNGKGSVSHMLASVLQQAGYCVGLFTSPHLLDFRERIRVNGECISEKEVVRFTKEHKEEMVSLGLSFFEMTTAMAFHHFAQSDVEVAVIECGLGGRLDATNIVIPQVSVITNIGLEHTDLLGDSLPKIAREKAGIIKKSIPVIVGEKNSAYNLVIEDIAADRRSEVIYSGEQFECHHQQSEGEYQRFDMIRTRDHQQYTLRIPLLGQYQRQNLATVCTIADYLHENTPLTISRRAFVEGLKDTVETTGFSGRWQVLSTSPYIVCDTAHNAHGLAQVAQQIATTNHNKLYCVMGFCSDKDIKAMLRLLPTDAHYIFTSAQARRAAQSEQIGSVAHELGLNFAYREDVKSAVEYAKGLLEPEDMLYIGGSTFVVSEIL